MSTTPRSDELAWMSGADVASLIRSRSVKPSEVVAAALQQIDEHEAQTNAFVTVLAEQAMDQAARADDEVMRADPADLPPLFGVPLTVKDLSATEGIRTTFGSTQFAEHVPDADSLAVGRLRGAGAILIGKTTTPEFGMLGVTESALTGVTNNPWRLSRTAGGSSGGAAVASASGMGQLAWGSDGGGSVRIPASYCGVVGLKASLRWIPGEHPWDSAVTDGPLTRTVVDQALLLEVTAGHHPSAPFSTPLPARDFVSAVRALPADLAGVRIAYAQSPSGAAPSAEVAAVVRRAIDVLAGAGAEVNLIELPLPDPVEYFIDFWGPAFLDPNAPLPHPAMRSVSEAAQRLTLERHLHTASETRAEITRTYNRVFEEFDLLITPTSPVAAFPHPGAAGGNTEIDGVPVAHPAIDFHRYTEPASHAGIPAITVPAGFDSDGMPVGMQLHMPQHQDARLLQMAAVWETLQPWAHLRPEFRL